MGSSAGVGAGVDLKDSDEVKTHLSWIVNMPNYWASWINNLDPWEISWWLGNITAVLGFRWRSILITWVWNTGWCWAFWQDGKKNLVLQIWVLSWKGSGSLSPSWRLLGRNQKGLHKGISRPVFGSESDYSIQALRIYTTNCDEYKHAHSCHKVTLLPSSQKTSDEMTSRKSRKC